MQFRKCWGWSACRTLNQKYAKKLKTDKYPFSTYSPPSKKKTTKNNNNNKTNNNNNKSWLNYLPRTSTVGTVTSNSQNLWHKSRSLQKWLLAKIILRFTKIAVPSFWHISLKSNQQASDQFRIRCTCTYTFKNSNTANEGVLQNISSVINGRRKRGRL